MLRFLAVLILCPTLVLADGGVTVALPDLSGIPTGKQPAMLTNIINAVVTGQNCPDYASSDGEWALLTGSADILATSLGLSVADHEAIYWGSAFDMLSADGICFSEGPKIAPLVVQLISLGGSTTPFN